VTVEGPSSLDLARRHAETATIANNMSECALAQMWALVSIAASLEKLGGTVHQGGMAVDVRK